jgi:Predicted redox protein, regulator of disulfide bond formation
MRSTHTLETHVRLIEGSTSVAVSRSHAVVIDRPENKGGTDTGFQGGELLLVALGGCFLSNLVAAAKTREISLHQARAHVVGETADAPARFAKITVDLTVASDSSDEEIDKLILVASRACIVTNTLKAGTELTIRRAA